MKAIIEASDGLHIIRIYENKGSLCDVFVVEDIELKKEIKIKTGDEKLIDPDKKLLSNLKKGGVLATNRIVQL